MNKIKLEVIVIVPSQTQLGTYTVVLQDAVSKKQISVVTGSSEAQSIAFALENIKPPRPLTHDLFKSFADSFNVFIREVHITKLVGNVFYAKICCSDGKNDIEIDSRTSDAIGLAVRFGCPIYTNEEVLRIANEFQFNVPAAETDKKQEDISEVHEEEQQPAGELELYSLEELEALLKEAIDREDFEKASTLRDEIKRRYHS